MAPECLAGEDGIGKLSPPWVVPSIHNVLSPPKQQEKEDEMRADMTPLSVGSGRHGQGDGVEVTEMPSSKEPGQSALISLLQPTLAQKKLPDVGVEKKVGRPPSKVQREKESAAQVDQDT